MARPKADLPSAAAIRAALDSEGRLAVRVTPGARSEGMAIEDERVVVKVRAKPQDGAANDAVIKLVASGLGIAKSRVELLRGATSREKLLKIDE
ncbi:DUF167 domain-containing protein [Altererythrobacter sp.]|uniref:DUF167 domain-containing protein n=1 Tax=Altererythrobacter sp. TaxID=1872480 RepID=UPI003D081597